jgi:flagellar hook protein FlgE
MLNSLNSGVAGIRNFQGKLDVIGNNIANSNTIAFKAARANFADTFSQTIQGGSVAGGSLQIGTGVMTSTIRSDFSRGGFSTTGRSSDLYINGPQGFFTVRDSEGREFATRAGDFDVDREGYLVTSQGLRVQGYNDQTAIDGAFATRGDIRIFDDPANRPAGVEAAENARYAGYNIQADGVVRIRLSDGTEYQGGQVLLQNFRDLSLLEKEGQNLYSNLQEAGPLETSVEPGSNGLGTIMSKALEMSNVDLAGEFAELITTQRGFQASARIITTSDEMLQEVVNLKR